MFVSAVVAGVAAGLADGEGAAAVVAFVGAGAGELAATGLVGEAAGDADALAAGELAGEVEAFG